MIYINIGSNLNSENGDRIFNIKKAIDLIIFEKIIWKEIEVEGLDVWIKLMSHSTPISVLLMY